MRSIIAPGATVPESNKLLPTVKQRVDADLRLPLALVDIRNDTAKVDSGPFVTSVLSLYDLASTMLKVSLPLSTEYDESRAYLETIFSVLRLAEDGGKLHNRDLGRWKAFVKDREDRQVPFQLDHEAIAELGAKFRERFGAQLVLPLVRLKPYQALIDEYEEKGLLRTKLEPWFSYEPDERDALLDALRASDPETPLDDPQPVVDQTADRIKKTYRLCYQVVFQRAFVLALHQTLIVGAGSGAVALWPGWTRAKAELTSTNALTRASERKFVDIWISRWNEAFGEAPMRIWNVPSDPSQSPFFGSGLRIGGEIDFRKPATERIASFVALAVIAPVTEWRGQGRGRKARVRAWVENVFSAIAPGVPSGIVGLHSYFGTRWRRSLEEVEQDLDPDRSVDELATAIVDRAVSQLLALM